MSDPIRFGCKNCGADLTFQPGTTSLVCGFCGTTNEITPAGGVVEELDYNAFLQNAYQQEEMHDVVTVRCQSCSAETSFPPNVTSEECPYCGTALVASAGSSTRVIKPKSLLPFAIEARKAQEALARWIAGRWFAPSNLKNCAERDKGLKGLYVPYWTYDCHTYTSYTGERGEHYWEDETYTEQENGQSVTKTRRVQKTRWYSASGIVTLDFDDILVLASKSLPENYARKLGPWDLKLLVPYQEAYLSGFRTETYQVDLPSGFEIAKRIMDSSIRSAINTDIGGDEQRIHSVNTQHSNITFKHVLLPVWIGSYRYKNKVYQIFVNARSGEVQGSRPYSWIKITLLVLTILIIIGFLVYLGHK